MNNTDPSARVTEGQYTDVSQVPKFEISEEDYSSRQGKLVAISLIVYNVVDFVNIDTVLAYKKAHRIGRFAPSVASQEEEEFIPENITLNARCEVDTGDSGLKKRGVVRFVGKTKFAKGIWVGIEYDEPLGKNDGS